MKNFFLYLFITVAFTALCASVVVLSPILFVVFFFNYLKSIYFDYQDVKIKKLKIESRMMEPDEDEGSNLIDNVLSLINKVNIDEIIQKKKPINLN